MNLEMIKKEVAELANFEFIAFNAKEAAAACFGLNVDSFNEGPGLYHIGHGTRGEIDAVEKIEELDIPSIDDLVNLEEDEDKEEMRKYYDDMWYVEEDCEQAGVLNFGFCEEGLDQYILVK